MVLRQSPKKKVAFKAPLVGRKRKGAALNDEHILNQRDSDSSDIDESDLNINNTSNNDDNTSYVNSSNEDNSDLSSSEEDDTPNPKKKGPSRKANSIVEVNGLKINIETITDQEMYALRKVLPRKEYRLLKNRKSARKSRRRRKAELSTLKEEIKLLKRENDALRKQID
jgi:bZIP transcription factor